MSRDALELASHFMRLRRFDKAINLLESRADIYEDNFDYYLLMGTACLYAGDIGSASSFFQKARTKRITDTNLLLGQAAIFLRRGDTDRAINYYFDILDNDPANKIARSAMEFIRSHGDFNTICRWADTGKLEQFYPPLGVNPLKITGIVIPAVACMLGCVLVLLAFSFRNSSSGVRADLSGIVLTVAEQKNALESDLSSGSFAYIMTSAQIASSYEKALRFFQQYRDNLSQIEINRILNSNAAVSVKRKARLLMGYLEPPSFDTLKDNVDYVQVAKEPALYLDCWVIWSGRVSNVSLSENSYSCDLLVGYESLASSNVEGVVPVRFSVAPVIEADKPVRILARISFDGGKICLLGKSVYQSIKNGN